MSDAKKVAILTHKPKMPYETVKRMNEELANSTDNCPECGDSPSESFRSGYIKALEDVRTLIIGSPWVNEWALEIVDQLKRAYEKGSDGNGKAE